MSLGPVIPVLRMFDEKKAKEFYVDFLGFTINGEHRFEPDLPLYMVISRAGCVLHLSEHHGDACPGAALRIQTDEIDALHAELTAKNYRYNRPGICETPWAREVSVNDPFGNRLTFATPKP